VGQEADLEQAYALGRTAMARGYGVLDMARIHQQALGELLPPLAPARQKKVLRTAEVFFLEALSPFEATHRGFRETNRRLHELITAQEKRNEELAEINLKLTREIRGRRQTEQALRRSERHFRNLFNEARAMQESLRNLSNEILNVQEAERKHISRELHDETGQALTAISVTLAGLGRNGQSVDKRRRLLADAQRLLQNTMETLHNFARELRPTMLDELGLLPALRSYLTAFAERTGLRTRFRANPAAENLDATAKTVLFRVAQESLTNIAKHAQATQVDFRIRKTGNCIRMIITDDGKSFQQTPEQSANKKHRLGLLGMTERVRLVGGQFAIRPQFGKGTTVIASVPLEGRTAAKGRNQPEPLPIPLNLLLAKRTAEAAV
jgi:signal transduction histidine kinase